MSKIRATPEWPFYNEYHNQEYIDFHDCRTSIVLRQEGQKNSPKYQLVNACKKEVVKYRIDPGVIGTDGKKCDYGVYTEDRRLILVEIKGGDYGHALKQIGETVDQLFHKPEVKVDRLDARVVLTRTPSPDLYRTEEKKLRKKLIVKNIQWGYRAGEDCLSKDSNMMKESI